MRGNILLTLARSSLVNLKAICVFANKNTSYPKYFHLLPVLEQLLKYERHGIQYNNGNNSVYIYDAAHLRSFANFNTY